MPSSFDNQESYIINSIPVRGTRNSTYNFEIRKDDSITIINDISVNLSLINDNQEEINEHLLEQHTSSLVSDNSQSPPSTTIVTQRLTHTGQTQNHPHLASNAKRVNMHYQNVRDHRMKTKTLELSSTGYNLDVIVLTETGINSTAGIQRLTHTGQTQDHPHSASTTKHITMYYQNVRGLRMKTKTFKLSSTGCSFDVIALTETGINSTIKNVTGLT